MSNVETKRKLGENAEKSEDQKRGQSQKVKIRFKELSQHLRLEINVNSNPN